MTIRDLDSIEAALHPYDARALQRYNSALGLDPGHTLGPTDAEIAHQFLPTPIAERALNGDHPLTIGRTRSYPLPARYLAATVENAGRASVDSTGAIQNYRQGLPFPVIDPDDPQAGIKVAWNLRFRSLGGDSETLVVDWTAFSGSEVEATQRMLTWRLRLTNRCTLSPRDLTPNPLDLYEVNVNEIVDPPHLRGWSSTCYRYNDPAREDDIWVSSPRQVKALRSDYRNEDGYGFNGPVLAHHWRYLGAVDVLAGVGLPTSVPAFGGKNGWYPVDPFQLRQCHVVETKARDREHHYPRRILYIDAETWMPVYTLGYAGDGSLFKLVFHLFSDPDFNPWSDGREGPINLGGSAINLARNHATLLPNTEQRFNLDVEDQPFIQAALAGRTPIEADYSPPPDFRWIAIGHTANVSEVLPGRLYRSGLPSPAALDAAGIDIVVNLSGRNPTDLASTTRTSISTGRMVIYWPIEDDQLPDATMLDALGQWLARLLADSNQKILVHCVASVNRSNLVIGQALHAHLGLGGERLIEALEATSDGYAILTNRAFREYLQGLPDQELSTT